jgi:hypothetical protein
MPTRRPFVHPNPTAPLSAARPFLPGPSGFLRITVFLLFFSPATALQTPPVGGCFVYPTPARDDSAWAVFNLPEAGNADVFIYNEAGDLVERERIQNASGIQQAPLDLTHFRNGIYLCRVVLNLDSGTARTLKPFRFLVVK